MGLGEQPRCAPCQGMRCTGGQSLKIACPLALGFGTGGASPRGPRGQQLAVGWAQPGVRCWVVLSQDSSPGLDGRFSSSSCVGAAQHPAWLLGLSPAVGFYCTRAEELHFGPKFLVWASVRQQGDKTSVGPVWSTAPALQGQLSPCPSPSCLRASPAALQLVPTSFCAEMPGPEMML